MAHSEDLAFIPNDRRVCVQVGENRGGGVEVKQEEMIEVLTALNNFIHEHKEWGVVAETWQSS